jgi:hypothetical protein
MFPIKVLDITYNLRNFYVHIDPFSFLDNAK